MTFSKTNNKPSTVSAKEGMLRVHLVPFFGSMKLDAIGPTAALSQVRDMACSETLNPSFSNSPWTRRAVQRRSP